MKKKYKYKKKKYYYRLSYLDREYLSIIGNPWVHFLGCVTQTPPTHVNNIEKI